jgi:hypothetical protein
MTAQRVFMAQLMRRYNATTESFIDGSDGWDQYTIRFPQFPDRRMDFIVDFNASGLFESFDIRDSQSHPLLYVEFKVSE